MHWVTCGLVWLRLLFGVAGSSDTHAALRALCQQIMQSSDRNTQLLANSIAATGKLRNKHSEAVAANIIGSMNSRECFLLLGRTPSVAMGSATVPNVYYRGDDSYSQ